MLEAIMKRRSIRSFTAEPVTDAQLERILRAGMQAPSAMNAQPWEFLIIRDPEQRRKLADLSQYGKPAAVCDTCIVVLSNLSRSRPGSQWWVQDLSACVQNILLQAVEEDLGAVWMGFYPNESRVTDAKALLELPEHIVPFAVIALGHPAQLPPPEDRFDSARVHFEHY